MRENRQGFVDSRTLGAAGEQRMELQKRLWIVTGLLSTGLFAASCGPAVEAGECAEGSPCPRGEMCNLDEAICELVDLPTDATESPAQASFTGKDIPFFRGQVCTVTETAAGEAFPVYMSPCLHPCLDVSQFEFKHSWTCTGSTCSAYAALFLTVDSVGSCPEDAFGQFAAGQCQYTNPVTLSIDPTYGDGSPVQGTMELEIPFLSNRDAEFITASGGDPTEIEFRIQQYPQDPGRIVSGAPISILDSNAAPPADCGDDGSACDCFEVGF